LASRKDYVALEAYKRWHTDDTSRFVEKYGVGMPSWLAWYNHIEKLLGMEFVERK